MTDEVRELMTWVGRWGSAVERPDLVARRDDMVRRYVEATLHPPAAEPQETKAFAYVDLGELPIEDDRPPPARRRRRR